MIYLILIPLVLVLLSIGYWLWQAHKEAKRIRKVFEPRPQTPTTRDLERLNAKYFEQHGNQFEINDDVLPMFLIKQAE